MVSLLAVVALVVGGQNVALEMPTAPTARVVVYVHGAGETAASSLADPQKRPVFAALVKAGYAVVADDAHGDNWGNPTSVQDYRALLAELHRRGLTKVYVLAQSMGGLDGLGLLRFVRPVAWAGIYPACNLRAEHELPSFAGAIEAAYPAVKSFGGPAIVNVRGLRMIFWASPQDTFVPKRLNTDLCAAAARKAGASVTIVVTRGEHGDPSNFQPARLVRFFSRPA